jgi:predicted MFS family arabinose efflux permease
MVSGVVSSLAPPFWLLLVRVLPAFLHPVFYATALGLVANGSDPKEGPRLLVTVLSGIGLATVTTIPLVTYVASVWGWQASFGVQAAVSALAFLFVYGGVPSLPVGTHVSYGEQVRILPKPAFLLGAALVFLLVAGWFCTYSYLADYLGQVKAMSPTAISQPCCSLAQQGWLSTGWLVNY